MDHIIASPSPFTTVSLCWIPPASLYNYIFLSSIVVKDKSKSSLSETEFISSRRMQVIIEKFICNQTRNSTTKMYLSVWRHFNQFLMKLDCKPKMWESRVTLFIAYLVDRGMQSISVKSYVSAIKRMLIDDGYPWEDGKILLTSLTRACRNMNDRLTNRFPIHCGFLEMILFEIKCMFKDQMYLCVMYMALYALGYYRLMRVGELTQGPHVAKACNVFLGTNKDKLLIILFTSKTHDLSKRPQKIKITANKKEKSGRYASRNFFPFKLFHNYIQLRGAYANNDEQFFVFRDKTPVKPQDARNTLKKAIEIIGLDPKNYNLHSLCIGRTSDLIKFGYSINEVKRMGRWSSNVVYKYIRS